MLGSPNFGTSNAPFGSQPLYRNLLQNPDLTHIPKERADRWISHLMLLPTHYKRVAVINAAVDTLRLSRERMPSVWAALHSLASWHREIIVCSGVQSDKRWSWLNWLPREFDVPEFCEGDDEDEDEGDYNEEAVPDDEEETTANSDEAPRRDNLSCDNARLPDSTRKATPKPPVHTKLKPKTLKGTDLHIWNGIQQPHGGSYDACLSALEIDSVVRPLIGSAYISADAFFRVRTGNAPGIDLERRIRQICDGGDWAYAAVHVRHHWTLGVFDFTDGGDLRAYIYDSAPSPVTRKDIFQVLEQCGIRTVKFVQCGKQPRNSVECGVHVVLHAWRTFLGYDALAPHKTIELTHLRATCAKLAKKFDRAEVERIAETPGHKVVKPPTGGASNAAQLAELAKMNANFARASPFDALEKLRDKQAPVRVVLKFRLDADDADEYEATGSLRPSFRAVRTLTVDVDVPEDHDAVVIQFGRQHEAVLVSAARHPKKAKKLPFVQQPEPETESENDDDDDDDDDDDENGQDDGEAAEAKAREPAPPPPCRSKSAKAELPQIPRQELAAAPALFRCSQTQPPALAAMKGDALQTLQIRAPIPLAEKGWTADTRARHRNAIKDAQVEIVKWHSLPLDEALVRWMEERRTTRKWAWATLHREMGNLQGALAHLQHYTDSPVPIHLGQSAVWVSAVRAADRGAKESESIDPPSCPFETLDKAATHADPWKRMALRLAWLTAARMGCILQLKRFTVQVDGKAAFLRTGRVRITFRRGKGVLARKGGYTVPTIVPFEWRNEFWTFIDTFKPDDFIFPAESAKARSNMIRELTGALRVVDPSMGVRAIRRGSLQTMARNKVPEADLLIFSGHTNATTLNRYLGWGLANEEKAERAFESAAFLHRPGGATSESKPPDGPSSN